MNNHIIFKNGEKKTLNIPRGEAKAMLHFQKDMKG